MQHTLAIRLADRLKQLRRDRGWSLDQLARRSRVSRATLSRLENADVSPTTDVLGRLCTVYALSMSRLIAMAEEPFRAVIHRAGQSLWTDADAGFRRRSVSPPCGALVAEVLECELCVGACLSYPAPAISGQEHHLIMLQGYLEITVEGQMYQLSAGDCLRYQLFGASEFRTTEEQPARYMLVLVGE